MTPSKIYSQKQETTLYLNAVGLHVFSQAKFIHLMCVGHPIVPHNGVCQGQDLTPVAGVSQGLGIPTESDEQHIHQSCVSLESLVHRVYVPGPAAYPTRPVLKTSSPPTEELCPKENPLILVPSSSTKCAVSA